MARRFFTADFHFGMQLLLDKAVMGENARPFDSITQMNDYLISMCNDRAQVYYSSKASADSNPIPIARDMIIHVGDLACFKSDRSSDGLSSDPQELVQLINADFVNVKGNHDTNNRVKNACSGMHTSLGKRFPNVTVGHYPSYDCHSVNLIKPGWIHLCGHVHNAWKHCLDAHNQVLNINVGIDVWNYRIVSEEELIQYIDQILKLPREKLNVFNLQAKSQKKARLQ